MENQKNPNQPEDNRWLDEYFGVQEPAAEISADELAMHEAGLSHPDDLELDRIIEETLAEDSTQKLPDLSAVTGTTPIPPVEKDMESTQYIPVESPLPTVKEPAPAKPADKTKSKADAEQARKGRPHRKKGYGLLGIPHILATLIWLAIIVAIGTSLGRMIWVCAADVLAFGREDKVVSVTITEDDTIEDIAGKLQDAGLIRYPGLFKLYADLAVDPGEIGVGTFELNTLYDYHALVDNMYHYDTYGDIVEVVVPEGYNCAQIFALLEEKEVCTVQELETYAASGELDEYWFLEDVERGDRYCLEGFLFPDTYEFYMNDDPRRVLEKFLNDFDYRFTEKMEGDLDALNVRVSEMMADNGYGEDYIAENQITIHDLVTIASLIEKESGNSLESYTISSVFYNRLTNQGEYPFLNSDAALYYALGGKDGELTAEDLQLDSPYNTHLYPGLIPGPIANPGLNSIYAALDPDDTNYHYFIYNEDEGSHHFSETYDEHISYAESLGIG